jgi:hypothetical protein
MVRPEAAAGCVYMEKVILFSKNRWIFATAKGNGRLFVENTQSLFEKSKTDVQGAENRFV